MAYILNFQLNFVFLDCSEKCGCDWSYRLSKILKKNQIIEYTQFHSNNDKNSNDKNGKIAFSIFIADLTILKNS